MANCPKNIIGAIFTVVGDLENVLQKQQKCKQEMSKSFSRKIVDFVLTVKIVSRLHKKDVQVRINSFLIAFGKFFIMKNCKKTKCL